MRNATIQDVEEAQRAGALKEDVMYAAYGQKVHGKKVRWILDSFLKRETGVSDAVLAETAQGEIIDVSLSCLKPLSKGGSAFTPRKPRPKPVKGTRPERRIPVDAGTEIKVGDVALFYNAVRGEVVAKCSDGAFKIEVTGGIRFYVSKKAISYVILPYEEPKKEEVTYKIGDRFDNNEYGPHILAQTAPYRIALISLRSGNRYTDAGVTKNIACVTQQELDMISGREKFTKQVASSE